MTANYELGRVEHEAAIRVAIDGRNDLVHAKFNYGCQKCHFTFPIFMGVGVEGPPSLQEKGLYIPSPFGGPACPRCKGETVHIAWNSDQHFLPMDPPNGVLCFVYPRGPMDMTLFNSSCFCGDTITSPDNSLKVVK